MSAEQWAEFVAKVRRMVIARIEWKQAQEHKEAAEHEYTAAAAAMVAWLRSNPDAVESAEKEDEERALRLVAKELYLDYDASSEFKPYRDIAARRRNAEAGINANLN